MSGDAVHLADIQGVSQSLQDAVHNCFGFDHRKRYEAVHKIRWKIEGGRLFQVRIFFNQPEYSFQELFGIKKLLNITSVMNVVYIHTILEEETLSRLV